MHENKFKEIQPSIIYKPAWPVSKNDQVSINRLRYGHTFLTHLHLISNRPAPCCDKCNEVLNVR